MSTLGVILFLVGLVIASVTTIIIAVRRPKEVSFTYWVSTTVFVVLVLVGLALFNSGANQDTKKYNRECTQARGIMIQGQCWTQGSAQINIK